MLLQQALSQGYVASAYSCTQLQRRMVCRAAQTERRMQRSRRLQQLEELGSDGWLSQPSAPAPPVVQVDGADQGWGISAAPSAPVIPGKPRLGRKAVQQAKAATVTPAAAPSGSKPQQPPVQPARNAAGKAGRKPAALRSPYMDIQSEQGVLGLALLQARLRQAEGAELTDAQLAGVQDRLAAVRAAKAGAPPQRRGTKGMAVAAVTAAAAAMTATAQAGQTITPKHKRRVVFVDDDDNIIGEEGEDEEASLGGPAFSLTLDDAGMEYQEFDRQGQVVKSRMQLNDKEEDLDDLDEEAVLAGLLGEGEEGEEELDFSGTGSAGWQQLRKVQQLQKLQQQTDQQIQEAEQDELDARTLVPSSTRDVEALLGPQGAAGSGSLLGGREQVEEEQDWGLEELADSGSRQTLLEQLGVVKPKRRSRAAGAVDDEDGRFKPGTLAADDTAVQWGGSGSNGLPAGVDLAAQEALLSRMFKPHKVKQLVEHQRAAYAASLELKSGGKQGGKFGLEAKLCRRLRIVGGSAANKRLLSSQGPKTRPMMEKVRAAIFNMILSQSGNTGELPSTARWLDLFAGTGSVGLEALSRGAATVHFVEYDQWVCRNILKENIKTCGFDKQAIIHTGKAEDFLQRAATLPRFAGGAFDFISMCPPYLLVSYPKLFALLEGSPLLHERTVLFVEYPKQLSSEVPEQLGALHKVRDRKYGRTWIAVFAPSWDGQLSRDQPEDDSGDEDTLMYD